MLCKEVIEMLLYLLRLFWWRLFMGTITTGTRAAVATAFYLIVIFWWCFIVISIICLFLDLSHLQWFLWFVILDFFSWTKIILWNLDLIINFNLIFPLNIKLLFIFILFQSCVFFCVVLKRSDFIIFMII